MMNSLTRLGRLTRLAAISLSVVALTGASVAQSEPALNSSKVGAARGLEKLGSKALNWDQPSNKALARVRPASAAKRTAPAGAILSESSTRPAKSDRSVTGLAAQALARLKSQRLLAPRTSETLIAPPSLLRAPNPVRPTQKQFRVPAAKDGRAKILAATSEQRAQPQSFFSNFDVYASFSTSATEITAGDYVSFYNESYASGQDLFGFRNYIASTYWTFGDGTSSWSDSPYHTYNYPGTYEVTLTVTDSDGNQDWAYIYIYVNDYVYDSAVYASFNASSSYVSVYEDIRFSSTASATGYNYGGTFNRVYSEAWDFGDSTGTYYGSFISHYYDRPGTYRVTQTVTDTAGNRAYAYLTVTVINESYPVAQFTASTQTALQGVEISFRDSSYETSPTGHTTDYIRRLDWDFGDGQGLSDSYQNVSHSYQYPGNYRVTLYVTDSLGRVASASTTVTITQAQSLPFSLANLTPQTTPLISRTIEVDLNVATADLGSMGTVFVVAVLPGGATYVNSARYTWVPHANLLTVPAGYFTGSLPATVHLAMIASADLRSLVGTQIYAGYGKGSSLQAAWADIITTGRYRLVTTIGAPTP